MPVRELADALPIPSGGEMTVVRAQRLFEDGRFHAALEMLDAAGPGAPEAAEADVLRARIQRQLLSPPEQLTSEGREGEAAGPSRR